MGAKKEDELAWASYCVTPLMLPGMPMRRASCTSGSASVFSAMASELAAMKIRVTTFLSKYQPYVRECISYISEVDGWLVATL